VDVVEGGGGTLQSEKIEENQFLLFSSSSEKWEQEKTRGLDKKQYLIFRLEMYIDTKYT
jgi:hypothetical protein